MMRGAPFAGSIIGAVALLVTTPALGQSLDVVINDAVAHSPALRAASARADVARAGVELARAERAPFATAEGQIGAGRIDPQGFFGLAAEDVVPRSARATVEYPLFSGGRTGAAIRQATSNAETADLQSRMALLELRVQVVESYAQAIAATQTIARYDMLIRALNEALRHARLKFEAGNGSSTEIAQAQARHAEAQAGLSGARGQLAGALSQLAALAGHPVVINAALPPSPPVPLSGEAATALALKDNPLVLAAAKQVDAARARADGAHAERLPTLGAYAEAATVRDQFFPGYKADSASAGLRARWTFFSGGRTNAKERAAAAGLRAAQADADYARQTVGQQAIMVYEAMISGRAVAQAASARLSASEAALRDTVLEVKAGAKPLLAQLDAEREVIEAQAAQAQADGQLLVAIYRLRAIAGMD
ncbi:MAG: TolC family protein [Sphingomonas sp.]|jgi:outer membrane protein